MFYVSMKLFIYMNILGTFEILDFVVKTDFISNILMSKNLIT
jgi:hypothetical protein